MSFTYIFYNKENICKDAESIFLFFLNIGCCADIFYHLSTYNNTLEYLIWSKALYLKLKYILSYSKHIYICNLLQKEIETKVFGTIWVFTLFMYLQSIRFISTYNRNFIYLGIDPRNFFIIEIRRAFPIDIATR